MDLQADMLVSPGKAFPCMELGEVFNVPACVKGVTVHT